MVLFACAHAVDHRNDAEATAQSSGGPFCLCVDRSVATKISLALEKQEDTQNANAKNGFGDKR